jgi:hypothetical protein
LRVCWLGASTGAVPNARGKCFRSGADLLGDSDLLIEGALVGVGPELGGVGGSRELRRQDPLTARLPQDTGDDVVDLELAPDFSRIDAELASIRSRPVATSHLEARDATERREDLVRQSVSKRRNRRVAADVVERQHRNRDGSACCGEAAQQQDGPDEGGGRRDREQRRAGPNEPTRLPRWRDGWCGDRRAPLEHGERLRGRLRPCGWILGQALRHELTQRFGYIGPHVGNQCRHSGHVRRRDLVQRHIVKRRPPRQDLVRQAA